MTYLSYINQSSKHQTGMLLNPGLQGVINRPQEITAFHGKKYQPTAVETYHLEKNQSLPVPTGVRRQIIGFYLTAVVITVVVMMGLSLI